MTRSKAAVLEPNQATFRRLAAGLKKAGLSVSAAREVGDITHEAWVVLGPSLKKPQEAARALRQRPAPPFLVAARNKGGKAPFADTVLPLPLAVPHLKARLPDWERLAAQASKGAPGQASYFQPFSSFKEILFIEVKRARRYGFPLSLALLAPDDVKKTGAPASEPAFQQGLSLVVRRTLRDIDFAVAYEPGRVLLLMPHTDLPGAVTVSQRVVERVAKTTIEVSGRWISPKVSVGVASGPVGAEFSFAELVRQASKGLQWAQEAGGNRVEFHDSLAAKAGRRASP